MEKKKKNIKKVEKSKKKERAEKNSNKSEGSKWQEFLHRHSKAKESHLGGWYGKEKNTDEKKNTQT